jgi:transcriptional regulator with XRE-family HTH domain
VTIGDRLRRLREDLGLTQAEVAARAGVSRQLIGALETDRQLPRIDVAMAMAAALGAPVSDLFTPDRQPVDVLTGTMAGEGALLRVGVVGERTVVTGMRSGDDGWDVADAVIEDGELHPLVPIRPGFVVAGCEPGLEVLERLLRERGVAAMAVGCSTAAALGALSDGRAHAAVVHAGPMGLPDSPEEVARFTLCRWRVGLAGPPDAGADWFAAALEGRAPIAQREAGAAVQAALERVLAKPVGGRLIAGHLEGARLAVDAGIAAVSIEPAALAVGASFHALETHQTQLWVAAGWLGLPAVEAALVELNGERFQRRLHGVGGYDLEGSGSRAA